MNKVKDLKELVNAYQNGQDIYFEFPQSDPPELLEREFLKTRTLEQLQQAIDSPDDGIFLAERRTSPEEFRKACNQLDTLVDHLVHIVDNFIGSANEPETSQPFIDTIADEVELHSESISKIVKQLRS